MRSKLTLLALASYCGAAGANVCLIEQVDVIEGFTAYDVSADGETVVGATDVHTCFGRSGVAAKWTEADGLVLLSSGTGAGVARAVNADGTVIVGRSTADGPGCCDDQTPVATVWGPSGRVFTPNAPRFYDVDNSGTVAVANLFYDEPWDEGGGVATTAGFVEIQSDGALGAPQVFVSGSTIRDSRGFEMTGDGTAAIGTNTFTDSPNQPGTFQRFGRNGSVTGTGYRFWGGGIECEYGGRASDDGSVIVLDGVVRVGDSSTSPRNVILRDGVAPVELPNASGWRLTAVSGDGRVIGGRLSGAPVLLRWDGVGYEQIDLGPALNAVNPDVRESGTVRALNHDGSVAVVNYNLNSVVPASVRVRVSDGATCRPDLSTDGANPGDAGYGEPDCAVSISDLTFYVEAWLGGQQIPADVTTSGSNPGDAAYGVPDTQVDVSDLTFFVEAWLAGCA